MSCKPYSVLITEAHNLQLITINSELLTINLQP